MCGAFSIRGFLRSRGALLVHFSTPMTRHRNLFFPKDLQNAMRLQGTPISFSTILATDSGPYQNGVAPASANAGGSIGIVVDINDDGSVETVGPSDDGTHFDESSGRWVSGGSPPSDAACARSIDQRTTSNEWFVKNYTTVGIFAFFPIMVLQSVTVGSITTHAEQDVGLDAVSAHFPDSRLLSSKDGRFYHYSRETKTWLPIDYDEIIVP